MARPAPQRYTPMITAAEEFDLVTRAKAGDSVAAGELLIAHDGFFRHLASKFRGDQDDLLQIARMAALECLKRFEPDRGYRFLTFASKKSTWALVQHCSTGGMIRVPTKQNFGNIRPALQRQAKKAKAVTSLDASAGGDRSVHEFIPDPRQIEREIEDREEHRLLYDAIDRLSKRERTIIVERIDGKTLSQIGHLIGLTKERVRQIEKTAYDQIRRLIGIPCPTPTSSR